MGIYLVHIISKMKDEDKDRFNLYWRETIYLVILAMLVFLVWSFIHVVESVAEMTTIYYYLEYYLIPIFFVAFLCYFVYIFARMDRSIFFNIEISEKTVVTLVTITTYWIFSLRLNENFPALSNLIFSVMAFIYAITFIILIYLIYRTINEYIPRVKSGIIVIPLNLVDILNGFILAICFYGFGLVNLYFGYPGSYKFLETASLLTFAYYGNNYLKELTKGLGELR